MTVNISVRTIRSVLYSLTALLLFAALFGSCFYLLSDYNSLVTWYMGLNDCFYKSSEWATDFFTPRIKSDGNMYSIIAIAVCSAGIFYVAWRRRFVSATDTRLILTLNRADMMYVAACLIITFFFWLWGNSLAMPAYDEVFSARDIAGINHFQGWAYYVLPNNHLLFNLLNGTLFHFVEDKVMTGRVLSLLGYWGVSVSLFFWFSGLAANRLLALLAACALSLQFFVWAFGFQARGYELYLMAEWGIFLSTFYYLQTQRQRWALISAVCCIVGYCIMPSFLYFHLGLLLFVVSYTTFYKTSASLFWKYQGMAILAIYLFYLPSLCFSGLAAITSNGYVLPMRASKTIGVFWEWLFPYFNTYIVHIFSDVHVGSIPVNTTLFLLPLLLLLFRNKSAKAVGLFFFCLWLATFVIVTAMRRPAFERNFIGHYSATMAALLVLIWNTVSRIAKSKKLAFVSLAVFGGVTMFFAIHFAVSNKSMLKEVTYEYNVNETYNSLSEGLSKIPPGSTLSYSDEAFYCGYIARKNGCKVSPCPTGKETFFIKKEVEALPLLLNDYVKVGQVAEYEIFRRNKFLVEYPF